MALSLRIPYPLLVSLALLLGACRRSAPAPKPVLEGSWDLASSTSTTYSTTGTQLTQHTVQFVNARYTTFTNTTSQVFASTGGANSPPQPYTRSGNMLTFYIIRSGAPAPVPTGTLTITQLTDNDLTLFSTEDSSWPPSGYTTYETHYTRR